MAETLARLQERFHRLISQPLSIKGAASALERAEPATSPLLSWIQARGEDDAKERLAIYSRSYFARLRDSLRDDFPCTARVAGAVCFDRIASGYIVAHPSTAPSLHRFGQSLPRFLHKHPVSIQRPDLADVARIEWARLEVFGEEYVPPLTETELTRLPRGDWSTLALRMTPACRLVDLEHSADAVWAAADRGEPIPAVARAKATVLVWRRDLVVRHRVAPPEEIAALRMLATGGIFSNLCETFLVEDGEPESAAALALAALRQWIVDQVVHPL